MIPSNEYRWFVPVAASLTCSSKNMQYIHIIQGERTNVHSLLLNVVKNHGQVVNPLKSWSRTRVCMQVLAQRMCRALFTEIGHWIYQIKCPPHSLYIMTILLWLNCLFSGKWFNNLFCVIAIEKKVRVMLFICCVKYCKCDTSRHREGNTVAQRIHNFLPAAKRKQWPPPSSGGLWYIYRPSNATRRLFVAQGDARRESDNIGRPFGPSVFPDNIRIWIIKVRCKWENVNETKDRQTLALIWWTRNEERGKLSQDHVRADTWETDEVEAIVFIWMQRQRGQRKHIRIGDPPALFVARRRAGSNRGSEGLSSLLCLCEHCLWHWHRLTQTTHPQMNIT